MNGNSITASYGYDNRLRVSSISAGTALNLSYTYFYNGNVRVETNNRANMNGRSVTYAYDYLNRWNSATTSATSGSYCWGQAVPPWTGDPNSQGYDRYGNLKIIDSTQCSSPALNVGVNGNNQISSSGFSYDAAGNLLGDGTNSFQWNDENRPTTANSVTYT